MDRENCTISILGGTGKEGQGLAYRWGMKGYKVIIGSRNLEKAQAAAQEISNKINPGYAICGMENQEAANAADIAVLTVPYSAHEGILTEMKPFLAGKILIDVTVPLIPPKVARVQMPAAGSAGMEAVKILGDQTMVVSAFQNISYENLLSGEPVECDVLVSGNDSHAKEIVLELVKDAGLTGWDAGPIENSMVAEGLTSILIGINKKHKVRSSGIRITGVS